MGNYTRSPREPSTETGTMTDKHSFIHLARPLPVAPVSSAYQGAITTAPLNVIIHPQVGHTYLNHSIPVYCFLSTSAPTSLPFADREIV